MSVNNTIYVTINKIFIDIFCQLTLLKKDDVAINQAYQYSSFILSFMSKNPLVVIIIFFCLNVLLKLSAFESFYLHDYPSPDSLKINHLKARKRHKETLNAIWKIRAVIRKTHLCLIKQEHMFINNY